MKAKSHFVLVLYALGAVYTLVAMIAQYASLPPWTDHAALYGACGLLLYGTLDGVIPRLHAYRQAKEERKTKGAESASHDPTS